MLLDCMCTFKVSKKPNVLNLQFKFCPLPLQKLVGGGAKKFVLRAYFAPLDLFLLTPLLKD